jgi:hypothetical protein
VAPWPCRHRLVSQSANSLPGGLHRLTVESGSRPTQNDPGEAIFFHSTAAEAGSCGDRLEVDRGYPAASPA